MLTKRKPHVTASVFTGRFTNELRLDLKKHNMQYPEITICEHKQVHDRFLIIDESEIYHIGASLKDLGKKLFAFSKLTIDARLVLPKSIDD